MTDNERVIAHIDDLQDGQMKEIDLGERSILLARADGQYYALGAHCSHYGGPLAKGILCNHHVVCPWHQTYFDIVTGNVEEPPGLNAVRHYELRVEGSEVIVTVPEEVSDGRIMEMGGYSPELDRRTFAIIGGGAAGHMAAETLRRDGFHGRIVMITREKRVPYDRPHLSKGYVREHANPYPPLLRSSRFYMDHDIEIMFDRTVTKVDLVGGIITFSDSSAIQYNALLVAAGSVPKRLNVPGEDKSNIFTFRSFDDAYELVQAVDRSRKILIVGSGFIGMEVASGLSDRGLEVTVVSNESVPMQKCFGDEIGKMLQTLHEERGVDFELDTGIDHFDGNGVARSAVLTNGKRIDADVVLVAIGSVPATQFIGGLPRNEDASLSVDRYLRVEGNCFAAGDVVRFIDWRNELPVRIEHWRTAQQQGRCAAHNMMGKNIEYTAVPFFWTHQAKVSIQYVGCIDRWDEIIFHGRPGDYTFTAFYVRDGRLLGAAGMNQNVKMAALAELMRRNQTPTPDDLRQGQIDFTEQLKPAGAVQ
jgi:NADPH-dependent 2,4-dienoyl-CoA reductase/sulfur reductase-like enzyme/nitrite reductase/ring-hydroxylating ferredoxin subunit